MKLVKSLKNGTRKKTAAKLETPKATPVAVPMVPEPSMLGATARSAAKAVTIEAKIDVGFGNTLFLRGEGPGLNWNAGVPLTCVDGSTWKWSGEAAEKLKFKLLLNDAVWASGEDLEAKPGERLEVRPVFS